METNFFDRVRVNLQEKRQNLLNWLQQTPAWKKQIRLGPAEEQAMHAHLQVLETAIAKTEDQTLCLCVVCHDDIEPSQLEMDYTACVCLDHLSEEERNRLEDELELSQKIQQALLPQQTPDIPGVELAAFSRPAHYVGGDYFDFFDFRNQAPGLVIGDVAGKGMSASLLVASLQSALRTLAPEHDSPAEVVKRLNSMFLHNIHLTTFVTLFLGRFDPPTRTLTYCNAGHNPPLLYRPQANGREPITWLRPTGPAVGLVEEAQFKAETVKLSPDDVLLLYTDGVTEAENPTEEQFGMERLAEVVRQEATLPAAELIRELRRRLQEFTGGQLLADDTTIVAGKIDG